MRHTVPLGLAHSRCEDGESRRRASLRQTFETFAGSCQQLHLEKELEETEQNLRRSLGNRSVVVNNKAREPHRQQGGVAVQEVWGANASRRLPARGSYAPYARDRGVFWAVSRQRCGLRLLPVG